MEIKTTMSYHFTPTKMAGIKMKLEYIMLCEKKSVTKGHILYDLILMKVQNRKIYRDRKQVHSY